MRILCVAAAALALTACVQPPGPPGYTTPHDLGTEHWAGGDSIFAGAGGQPGAAYYIEALDDVARAGSTIVEVSVFNQPQPTVRGQLEAAIARYGPPRRIIIHAGMADLFARAWLGGGPPFERYAEAYAELDAWLVPRQATFARFTSSCSARSCALRFRQMM